MDPFDKARKREKRTLSLTEAIATGLQMFFIPRHGKLNTEDVKAMIDAYLLHLSDADVADLLFTEMIRRKTR